MTPVQYLKDRVENQINWYDGKSQWNQRYYKILRAVEILCSVSIPFCSGYIHVLKTEMTFVVGFLGLTVAAIAGLLSLFKFHENWVKYRTTCETLKKEKILYLTRTAPYIQTEDKNYHLFVQRFESFISRENINWAQYTTQPPEADNQQQGGN